MLPISSLSNEAELLKLSFEDMLVQWGNSTPTRTTLHASAVLVPQSEWCVREHVLTDLYPHQVQPQKIQPWDWKKMEVFLHGWEIHRMIQHLVKHHGRIVYSEKDGLPELDLTHYDENRNVFFSPDVIMDFGEHRYVGEIKGVKQAFFETLTDDLAIACAMCETVEKARIQANLYMHLLGLKRAFLLIWNKNAPDFKLWVTEYDPALSVKYVQRMHDVQGAIINIRRTSGLKLTPHRICTSAGDARAKKCPMRDVCFSQEMED